jgi:diguanylate cyclase (GGDEF)-like protein
MPRTNSDEITEVTSALERKFWQFGLPPALEAQFEAKTVRGRNRSLAIWLLFSLAYTAAYLAVDLFGGLPLNPAIPHLHWAICAVLVLAAFVLAMQPPRWVCSLTVILAYLAHTAVETWVGLNLPAPFGDRDITVAGFMILVVNVTSPLRFRDCVLLSVLSVLAYAGILLGPDRPANVLEGDHVMNTVIVAVVSAGIVLQRERAWRRAFLLGRLDKLRLLELARISDTDALTTLPNRRAFETILAQQWDLSRETGESLGLLIADVDNFKRINDLAGHAAGDHCLRNLAAVMRSSVRPGSDVVARLGGEEFVVVLGNVDLPAAAEIAERLRRGVEAAALPHPAGGVVTVSVGYGIATPALGGRPDVLLSGADHALYEAKAAGKNRIAGWNGTLNPPLAGAGWVTPLTSI